MKRFRVLVGAKGIVLATPEGQRTGGFFATRFVDAVDGDEAKRKAMELILHDSRLTSVVDIAKVRGALTVEELEQGLRSVVEPVARSEAGVVFPACETAKRWESAYSGSS